MKLSVLLVVVIHEPNKYVHVYLERAPLTYGAFCACLLFIIAFPGATSSRKIFKNDRSIEEASGKRPKKITEMLEEKLSRN